MKYRKKSMKFYNNDFSISKIQPKKLNIDFKLQSSETFDYFRQSKSKSNFAVAGVIPSSASTHNKRSKFPLFRVLLKPVRMGKKFSTRRVWIIILTRAGSTKKYCNLGWVVQPADPNAKTLCKFNFQFYNMLDSRGMIKYDECPKKFLEMVSFFRRVHIIAMFFRKH